MKRLLSIIPALAFVLLINGNAFGQTTITASAEVQPAISSSSSSNVNFGIVQRSSSPVLDPNGTDADISPSASIGVITVTGAAANTQLIVDWNQASVTLGDGSSGTLTYTPDVDGNTTNNASTSGDITKNTAGSNTVTDNSGNLYIFIGGNLGTIGSSQTAGTYSSGASNGSGDLEFTINYQ